MEAAFLIRTAIDSYVDADTSLAAALDDIDDRLDELQVQYVQAIFQSHSELNITLQGAVQMAMIGRYYERIGDHAVNIGERVLYMVTGWLPEKTGSARQRLREAEAAPGSRSRAGGTRGARRDRRDRRDRRARRSVGRARELIGDVTGGGGGARCGGRPGRVPGRSRPIAGGARCPIPAADRGRGGAPGAGLRSGPRPT